MIVALMMGRAGSRGFPGKNIKKVLGKHLFEYPLLLPKILNMLTKFLFRLIVQLYLELVKNMERFL